MVVVTPEGGLRGIGVSGVKLDTTCGVGHYLTKIHALLVALISTSYHRLLTKSAVTFSEPLVAKLLSTSTS